MLVGYVRLLALSDNDAMMRFRLIGAPEQLWLWLRLWLLLGCVGRCLN